MIFLRALLTFLRAETWTKKFATIISYYVLKFRTIKNFNLSKNSKSSSGPKNYVLISGWPLNPRLLYQVFLTLQKPRKFWDRSFLSLISGWSLYQMTIFRVCTVIIIIITIIIIIVVVIIIITIIIKLIIILKKELFSYI